MKRFVVLVILGLMLYRTGSANAEGNWILTAETDKAKTYVDATRLKKIGVRLLAFEMADLTSEEKSANGKSYMSTVVYYSVDCAQRGLAIKALYYYKNNLAKGNIVDSVNVQTEEMHFPPPNSVGEAFIETACFLNVSRPKQANPFPS